MYVNTGAVPTMDAQRAVPCPQGTQNTEVVTRCVESAASAWDSECPVGARLASRSRAQIIRSATAPERRSGATTRELLLRKRETAGMAFGQPSGPPAPAHRVRQLLALLHDAGHTDFRDARGPMEFTQRQAGGKFTRDEVDAFIDQLEAAARSESPSSARTSATRPTAAERALREMSSDLLAAELQRRGWIVAEP